MDQGSSGEHPEVILVVSGCPVITDDGSAFLLWVVGLYPTSQTVNFIAVHVLAELSRR
jgi:hypothetical protein